jgi:hypothetical protein
VGPVTKLNATNHDAAPSATVKEHQLKIHGEKKTAREAKKKGGVGKGE